MTIYIFLFGVLLSAGLFFITADLLRLPTLATQKAILSSGKQTKEKPKTIDMLLRNAAIRLCHYIRMDQYKKSRMANVLSGRIFRLTELFMAMAIVQGDEYCALHHSMPYRPTAWPHCAFTAILVYFKESVQTKLWRQAGCDRNCHFVAAITQELKPAGMCCPYWKIQKKCRRGLCGELDILTEMPSAMTAWLALNRFNS